jgi:hypothetical protein
MSISILLLAAATDLAQDSGIAIEHKPVACLVAGRYPAIDAGIEPRGSVARARVLFRAEGTADWYFVEMKPEKGLFRGTLPRPLKTTKKIEYYLEAVDRGLQERRTADYAPLVVGGANECPNKMLTAAVLTSAKIALGALGPGVTALPAGFSGLGVIGGAVTGSAGVAAGSTAAGGSAGGGGLSAGALAGIGGAAAAAAAAVVVSQKGDDANDRTTTSTTTTTYSGAFNGRMTLVGGSGAITCAHATDLNGNVTIGLVRSSDGSVSGTFNITGSTVVTSTNGDPRACSLAIGENVGIGSNNGPINGTAGSIVFRSQQFSTGAGGLTTSTLTEFQGALSGNSITGTVTYAWPNTPPTLNGSTSFNVLLTQR